MFRQEIGYKENYFLLCYTSSTVKYMAIRSVLMQGSALLSSSAVLEAQ